MKDADARRLLQALVTRLGSQRAAAAHLQISQQYLCDVLANRRTLSERLLRGLGLTREVTIRKVS